jgi:hypothetical protein
VGAEHEEAVGVQGPGPLGKDVAGAVGGHRVPVRLERRLDVVPRRRLARRGPALERGERIDVFLDLRLAHAAGQVGDRRRVRGSGSGERGESPEQPRHAEAAILQIGHCSLRLFGSPLAGILPAEGAQNQGESQRQGPLTGVGGRRNHFGPGIRACVVG